MILQILAVVNTLFFVWMFLIWSRENFLNQMMALALFILAILNLGWGVSLFFPNLLK